MNGENSFFLPVILNDNSEINLVIYPDTENSFQQISAEDAEKFGEAEWQLTEGCIYSFKINEDGFKLTDSYDRNKSCVIKNTGNFKSSGLIKTGNFTGALELNIADETGIRGQVRFEIRSVKTDYRTHYRTMLQEIAEECTELLMQSASPVSQKFDISDKDSRSAYQRFSFIKSLVLSEHFQNAIHKILTGPVTDWEEEAATADIRKAVKFSRASLKQIASAGNRINYKLNTMVETMPARITMSRKTETIDTQENRFIKYALTVFLNFFYQISEKLNKISREEAECRQAIYYIEELLSRSFFRELSEIRFLHLNSPVLQRKDGYREVYRTWLLFDLASKLVWQGGDDVYDAGKRDVARLYEYWLFFKLRTLCSKIFGIKPGKTEGLIAETKNGLGLKLQSGKDLTIIHGEHSKNGRTFKIKLCYNRSFNQSEYPVSGSWSVTLRPDYTLSIWPAAFTEEEAEKQEIIVHIQFDAKYKIENMKQLLEADYNRDDDEEDPGSKEKKGYKREDLLKMHAYKDAIRRTAGAYILYPGKTDGAGEEKNSTVNMQGFHEIIPGLGAFAVNPANCEAGLNELKIFIEKVIDNFTDRTSHRERMSYQTFSVLQKKSFILKDSTPEKLQNIRTKSPADIYVLVGYFQGKQKDWINENNLYNIRFEGKITAEMISASYLLLYEDNNSCRFYQVADHPELPAVFSKKQLLNLGYPYPSAEEYFIYPVEPINDPELALISFNIIEIKRNSKIIDKRPFAITLAELLTYKI